LLGKHKIIIFSAALKIEEENTKNSEAHLLVKGLNIKKRVPYISFSTNRLRNFLDLILELEPIPKEDLVSKASIKFNRSKKTMKEFVLSLENLGLIVQKNRDIFTSDLSKKMLTSSRKAFWNLLRENLQNDDRIISILEAIQEMSSKGVKVKSNENYYKQLSTTLQANFGFSYASPRGLDRFITLFRKMHLLDHDPFLDEYFLVSKYSVSDDALRRITKREYEKLKDILKKKTGTTWVPIDQLASQACRKEGIEVKTFNSFLRRALEKGEFQFAQASGSRVEVRERGIEKGGTIYYYVKIPEMEEEF